MIKVQELENYLKSVKDRLEAVNFTRTLIDESDINKDIEKRSAAKDKHMVYAVIPETDTTGTDDTARDKNYMGFMVLHKSNYRADSAHADWLRIFAETQETLVAFRQLLLEDKRAGYENCGFLKFLETASIHMEPVKWLASCNGWMLTVDIITDF